MFTNKEEWNESFENVSNSECRLCLQVADKSDCVSFNEFHKEILEVLLTKVIVNQSPQSFICNNCINLLHKSFDFKSMCLYTEDSLTPFMNTQNLNKIDIPTIFQKIHNDKNELLLMDLNICRFCLKKLENDSFTFLKDLSEPDLDMLKKVVPELQLEAIKAPIICEVCLYCFKDALKFINMCLNTLKWSDDSSTTSLKHNLAPISDSGSNLVSSETDNESSREPNDDTIVVWTTHEEPTKTFKCHKCNLVTRYKTSLYKHMRIHEGSKAEIYKCDQCPFKTKHKLNCKRHKLRHMKPEEVRLYKCQLCEYSTRYKYSLTHHQLVHEDTDQGQLYKCDSCLFVTKYRHSMIYHEKRHGKSLQRKTYKCDLCEYRTMHKYYLPKHRLVHVSVEAKIYKCKLCEFSTKYRSSLGGHQIVHKMPDEVKLYQCETCQFTTKYKQGLKKHQISHKKPDEIEFHKCQLCPYRTKYKDNLTQHKKVHSKPDNANIQ